ncbi:MAG: HAMP domain-containing protein [Granulosicoccus sp.]|nr:HAMP domain-containing protein [Granulosicoccus sp.]
MNRWFTLSLSARLLIIFMITALAATLLMMGLFSRGLGSQWQRAIAPHLIQYVRYVQQDLGMPPDETRARMLAERLPIQIQVHRDGDMLFTTANVALNTSELRFFKPGHGRRARLDRSQLQIQRLPRHEIAFNDNNKRPVLRLKQADYTIYVEFGASRGRGRGLDELLYAIAGLALLLGVCYLGIRRLLAPIARLQSTVQKISDGDLAARSREKGQDDLARLANSVDTMSDRLQQMLDAKRELLLAISHELRSPLTRARVATELLEPSGHQEKLIKDIDEMEALIAQLVESERLQEHTVLNRQWLDINKLITRILESIEAPVSWQSLKEHAMVNGDESRLIVLIRNLLNNALQHGKRGTESEPQVSIVLQTSDHYVQIIVTDDGPGIDPEHLDAVTDAFYRPDASRTRKTGGFGLGLYLCRRIAEAHGGSLQVLSPHSDGSGTQVTVQLPRE